LGGTSLEFATKGRETRVATQSEGRKDKKERNVVLANSKEVDLKRRPRFNVGGQSKREEGQCTGDHWTEKKKKKGMERGGRNNVNLGTECWGGGKVKKGGGFPVSQTTSVTKGGTSGGNKGGKTALKIFPKMKV